MALRSSARWASAAATPATKWDAGGATIIRDVDAAKEVVFNSCGMDPNLLVLPRRVYTKIKRLAKFLDLIKYTPKGILTEELLAEVFGVAEVVVAGGIENKANEGQAISLGQIRGQRDPSPRQSGAGHQGFQNWSSAPKPLQFAPKPKWALPLRGLCDLCVRQNKWEML